jgi:hypothetical protein
MPEELSLTKRYMLAEQRDLRSDFEELRRKLVVDLQKKEFSLVEQALSYSANTVNFFFIFLTAILMAM